MKFLRAVLPNLTIALNVALLIVLYLDRRNPMMGFLVGTPFATLVGLTALCAVATSVVLYADWRKGNTKKSAEASAKTEKNT